jgi:hypothetical protein
MRVISLLASYQYAETDVRSQAFVYRSQTSSCVSIDSGRRFWTFSPKRRAFLSYSFGARNAFPKGT